ncbi:MAG: hypothetical protein KDE63_02415 [Novosphingobium sp.]|nr:hypothetical protein [Novosphingobium sp.]
MDSSHANVREEYRDPDRLRCDTSLSLEEREQLLSRWKDLIDERLNSESEGMGAPVPISAEDEGRLADEERRVNNALNAVRAELARR